MNENIKIQTTFRGFDLSIDIEKIDAAVDTYGLVVVNRILFSEEIAKKLQSTLDINGYNLIEHALNAAADEIIEEWTGNNEMLVERTNWN